MPNAKKQCKCCKESFPNDENGMQTRQGWFANYEHMQSWLKADAHKKRQKQIAKSVDNNLVAWGQMQVAKPKRKHTKLEEMSISQLKEVAQKEVNKIVRARDAKLDCITCDKPSTWKAGQWDAAHYRSVGSSSNLRFNVWNIHKACNHCNQHESARHTEAYRPALIEKIGIDKVEWLDANAKKIRRYDKEYLLRLIRIARKWSKRSD